MHSRCFWPSAGLLPRRNLHISFPSGAWFFSDRPMLQDVHVSQIPEPGSSHPYIPAPAFRPCIGMPFQSMRPIDAAAPHEPSPLQLHLDHERHALHAQLASVLFSAAGLSTWVRLRHSTINFRCSFYHSRNITDVQSYVQQWVYKFQYRDGWSLTKFSASDQHHHFESPLDSVKDVSLTVYLSVLARWVGTTGTQLMTFHEPNVDITTLQMISTSALQVITAGGVRRNWYYNFHSSTIASRIVLN